MKKILSLALAVMMLALCPVMAATAETAAMQTLVSPDGSYSFEVPTTYTRMDSQVFLTIFSTQEAQQMLAQMLGLSDASQVAQYFELMEANNMMIIFDDTMSGNLNVQVYEAALTMHQLIMLKDMMDQAMVEQYASLGLTAEDITFMEIQQHGNYQWYGLKLQIAGMEMQLMITVVDGVQYTFSFSDIDEAEMIHVLESFRVQE